MTGIPKLVERADFASRTVYVELPAIPESQRLTEEECEREFVARWPRILGCLLEVVARTQGTAARPAHLPRMADFGVWMARATPALGWHNDKFTEAYTANRALAAVDVVEADPIGPAILELAEKLPEDLVDGWLTQRWEGSATALVEALPVSTETRKQRGFPHPNTLPAHLRRLRNSLSAQGIEITLGSENRAPGKKRTKTIIIERLVKP